MTDVGQQRKPEVETPVDTKSAWRHLTWNVPNSPSKARAHTQ